MSVQALPKESQYGTTEVTRAFCAIDEYQSFASSKVAKSESASQLSAPARTLIDDSAKGPPLGRSLYPALGH